MAKKQKKWLLDEVYQKYAEELYKDYLEIPEKIQDFEILSTIRYDPKLSKTLPTTIKDINKSNFFLLQEHYHRLQFTMTFFKINDQIVDISFESLVTKLIEAIEMSKVDILKPYKIRLLVKLNGEIAIEIYETPEKNLFDGLDDDFDSYVKGLDEKIWNVYVDDEPTMISPFTSFKTTYRPHYTDSRTRNLPKSSPLEEVIIWNTQQTVMEGSITNIAIKSENTWVTPELSCGCLCGVMRHFLLQKGYLKEGVVKIHDINVGDEILLFNGVMGIVRGRVVRI